MKRSDRRSDCPTNFALESLGDAWSLLIVRDLMLKGKRTYTEFANSEERISTNILAARLKSLQSSGIVRRDGKGRETRYSLTQKGLDLLPMMVDMIVWSATYDPDTAAPREWVRRAREDRAGLLSEIEAGLREGHAL